MRETARVHVDHGEKFKLNLLESFCFDTAKTFNLSSHSSSFVYFNTIVIANSFPQDLIKFRRALTTTKLSLWINTPAEDLPRSSALVTPKANMKSKLILPFQITDAMPVQRHHRFRSPALSRILAVSVWTVTLRAVPVSFRNRRSLEVSSAIFHGHY